MLSCASLPVSVQVSQLQAALDAKSQQSQEAQVQLAAAGAQLTDTLKERAALSEELSAEKSRVCIRVSPCEKPSQNIR